MFHIRLKLLRKLMNLTQPDMALLLNMAPNAYQRYELGTREPKFDILIKMADYFCVSIDYLLGRSDDPEWEKYLLLAEEAFFTHSDTWPELIEQYKREKASNPISLAPVFLRSAEDIRDYNVQERPSKSKHNL